MNQPGQSLRRLYTLGMIVVSFLIVFGFFSSLFDLADSVGHFRWHLSLLLMLLALPGLFVLDLRMLLVMLSVAVIGFAGTQPYLWSGGEVRADGVDKEIRLMQFNLSFRNRKLESVVELIRHQRPDVITLQEVTRRTGEVISRLSDEYPYHIYCPFSAVGGVAVLSRYPVMSGKSQGCIKGEGLAWLQILVDGRPLSIASLHLHWPFPYGQHSQLTRLERHFRNIPRPVLIAGDFNAAPWSNAITRITNATDTHVSDELLFSFSYPLIRYLPSINLPIDHVLLPDQCKITKIELGPTSGSDHHSVFTRIVVYGS